MSEEVNLYGCSRYDISTVLKNAERLDSQYLDIFSLIKPSGGHDGIMREARNIECKTHRWREKCQCKTIYQLSRVDCR